MKKIAVFLFSVLLFASCDNQEEQLCERAAELCQYLPDHALSQESQNFMTPDFYAVLDTVFNRLPEYEAMDHEWLHYFVTSNGGTIADYEVTGVELTDDTHAEATVMVRQKWEDGSSDESSDMEEHWLSMEKVGDKWLMSDFDGHKKDCIHHIQVSREEQALRDAMNDYLVSQIGSQYLQGELCIPTLLIVAEEEGQDETQVWCDSWLNWYNVSGDTLKSVSGGNHSGRMTLRLEEGKPVVTAFEQTSDGSAFLPSAKRIFGEYYDIFQSTNSNDEVRQAARRQQTLQYARQHQLPVRYYQDASWPPVALE